MQNSGMRGQSLERLGPEVTHRGRQGLGSEEPSNICSIWKLQGSVEHFRGKRNHQVCGVG